MSLIEAVKTSRCGDLSATSGWRTVDVWKSGPAGGLCVAAAGGHLASAKWLLAHYDYRIADRYDKLSKLFYLALVNGNLSFAEWLAEDHMDFRDVKRVGLEAFPRVCKNYHPAVMKWLVSNVSVPVTASAAYRAFCHACLDGNGELARWLAAEFKISREIALRGRIRPLYYACSSGGKDLVEWLLDEYKITAGDIREDDGGDNSFLSVALANGHLDLAKYLTRRYKTVQWNIGAHTLYSACSGGRLDAAVWLSAAFGLTVADARYGDNAPFRSACKNGHINVAKWLVGEFGLVAADVQSKDNYALRHAHSLGLVEISTWISEEYGAGGPWGEYLPPQRRPTTTPKKRSCFWFW